ncbi:MAG TPA: hypothetical protein VFG35_23815 [Actinoplanes sp.]|nr:hypothetical protein [Actinoplanes sp.]
MQISSYAHAAFDTARSTFKGLAEAAVKQPNTPETPAAAATPAEKPVVEPTEAPKPIKGQRQGVSLDSYA